MNKKGFTLVELIAVILVLGVILTLGIPAIIDTTSGAKKALANEQIKNLKDAIEVMIIDLNQPHSNIYNCMQEQGTEFKIDNVTCEDKPNVVNYNGWTRSNGSVLSCGEDFKCTKNNSDQWNEIEITVKFLKLLGYFEDNQKHCEDNSIITINKKSNSIGYDVSAVDCSK